MKKYFAVFGLASGTLSWWLPDYVYNNFSIQNYYLFGFEFNISSIMPGIIFGIIIGLCMLVYLRTPLGSRLAFFVTWVMCSTVAYYCAWWVTISILLGPAAHFANSMYTWYTVFAIGGLAGSFLLALFLKIWRRINGRYFLILCINGAVLASVGSFLDNTFMPRHEMQDYPFLFIIWQTVMAGVISAALISKDRVAPPPVSEDARVRSFI